MEIIILSVISYNLEKKVKHAVFCYPLHIMNFKIQ